MNDGRKIEPAETDTIRRGISASFGFLEDITDRPSLLHVIPSGSALEFRTIRIGPHRFWLTAFRPKDSTGEWSCRVTKYSRVATDGFIEPSRQHAVHRRGASRHRTVPRLHQPTRLWGGEITAKAPSADAAFDHLQQILRRRLGAQSTVGIYG